MFTVRVNTLKTVTVKSIGRKSRGDRMGDDCWRIDDLAHEAGITVDTIRYYAREGLMPAPTPAGRHRLYGDRHLDRLRRIRELQERRFSLAAIRAIVETNQPGIDELFSGSGRTYTLAEL